MNQRESEVTIDGGRKVVVVVPNLQTEMGDLNFESKEKKRPKEI